MANEEVPIPEPRGIPFLGHIAEFNPENPLLDLYRLADTYGEIYRLRFPGGKTMVFVNTQALVNEVCDESRFIKTLNNVLNQVRNIVQDGLFTARQDEPNWGIAHRVLIPAFGPVTIRGMFDEMYDIATQMVMKWARHGPSVPILASEDFTRLTLDTIALCAMDYRFNSYYREELHPFVQAMADALTESGNRYRRPAFANSYIFRGTEQKFRADIELLRQTAREVVMARKEHPTERRDLLSAMMNGVDPKTGQKMTDESMVDNLITFLIAGHETTSGLLSFAFYEMLKKPSAYREAQQEVDDVIGTDPVTIDHLSKLPYLNGVLRETLRLSATIPGFGVEAMEDTLIAGKYAVKKGEPIGCMLGRSHLDPLVYGEDAKEFKPERMLDANFERLQKEFPNSWKPFGNGMRACIGRPFAWQEALLATAMLLQNFNFTMDDPNYQLKIHETLTIKPKDFYMRASLRHGLSPTELEHRLLGRGSNKMTLASRPGQINGHKTNGNTNGHTAGGSGKPLSVYYGSNSGTCEALAQRLATDAAAHGFNATVIAPADDARENLPKDHPAVIITASYEGQPPDNAAHFVAWLASLKANELKDTAYAVFGCGHRDWVQTFHRIPKLVDSTMEKHGATRLAPMGLTDASERDMFSDFEVWEDDVLWPALAEKYDVSEDQDGGVAHSGLTVQISNPRTSTLRQDVQEAVVAEEKTLVASEEGRKKHIEVQLPPNTTYRAGDYLAVLPLNPRANVDRAFRRFKLAWDACLTISGNKSTPLPVNQTTSAFDVLSAYVELAQPATRRNIASLAEAAGGEETRNALEALSGKRYHEDVTQKRVTVLDLLEKYADIDLPIGSFLAMLPPMRTRQYSISSSPLRNPSRATLTYSLLDEPSLSGTGRHVGVATSYLSALTRGDKLHVAVRPSHAAFHLPIEPEKTPLVLVAAGSGIAPFRGFVQERAAMIAAGRSLAPALLFFGCRRPGADDLYRAEFERWEEMGAVVVKRAYSRDEGRSEGCRYVQHRLYHDREQVAAVWARGAKLYVCGTRSVGKAVEEVCVRILMEAAKEGRGQDELKDMDYEGAKKWFEGVRNERYATDVFD
ncbi:Bifunctional cytochrome P450/NADPH--P450 reductase [Colletotrichum orbiculare MAFF 240422]|uniref:Bifunctional cytochrome P450/NADPH--P450 reductase n=1 Tax=Colletotrichum orbiculare (strain 104-T / ATCC 96160 / CBS 514.97 / LARS 414 / MAFF 240422) TaxID=1213857 RepID=A0A484FFZ4_COLOR|nr:Bifunctional cytochrome P450/NADPH--P450 reductase [Colletotrichum orbiculare MAFF 240422]